jgi:hypothetical protein
VHCPDPFHLPTAEKVSSLGKDWHKFCLKCERCNKTLTPGGHAEVSVVWARDGGGGWDGWGSLASLNTTSLPSTMGSPSVTSPVMPHCLDPKVSAA